MFPAIPRNLPVFFARADHVNQTLKTLKTIRNLRAQVYKDLPLKRVCRHLRAASQYNGRCRNHASIGIVKTVRDEIQRGKSPQRSIQLA